MRSRPAWEDDDGAGAGQDLFATALIAMILITAAYLMEIGQRRVKAPEKLPDNVVQEWRFVSNGAFAAVRFDSGEIAPCVPQIPGGQHPIEAFAPFGYLRIERPPAGSPNTSLRLFSKPVWVESCD